MVKKQATNIILLISPMESKQEKSNFPQAEEHISLHLLKPLAKSKKSNQ